MVEYIIIAHFSLILLIGFGKLVINQMSKESEIMFGKTSKNSLTTSIFLILEGVGRFS